MKDGYDQKQGKKYHVQIRKIGYPPVTRSFSSMSVARRWAKSTEADMERRLPVCIPDPFTVGDLLERYELEVVPSHKVTSERFTSPEPSESISLRSDFVISLHRMFVSTEISV
mgnify:CR=1 FL=1